MNVRILIPALIGLLTTMPVSAQADPLSVLDTKIESIRDRHEIVGLSALAIRDGEIIWQTHLGFADLEREIPVVDKTMYRVASISKIASSIALMQLWERGKFKLDDDISERLGYPVVNPHFPDKPITYRHLLTHTSGIRDGANYNAFLMASYRAADAAPNIRDLIHAEGESHNDGANFSPHEPGAHYQYSNLNYGIIGTLVEKISGERFDVYCRENILIPLGMDASFNLADLPDINRLAVLYRPGDDGWNPQFDQHNGVHPGNRIGSRYEAGRNAIVHSPQGGLRASALDLTKLMWPMMGATLSENSIDVLQAATLEQMLASHWENGKTARDYRGRGLGFHRTRNVVPGELWVGHSGRAYGLLAAMFFREDARQGIVLVTNGSKPGRQEREFYEMERALFRAIREFIDGT